MGSVATFGVESRVICERDQFTSQLGFPQFPCSAGLCGGPENVLRRDELEGTINR
jgi:hypothetical protein